MHLNLSLRLRNASWQSDINPAHDAVRAINVGKTTCIRGCSICAVVSNHHWDDDLLQLAGRQSGSRNEDALNTSPVANRTGINKMRQLLSTELAAVRPGNFVRTVSDGHSGFSCQCSR